MSQPHTEQLERLRELQEAVRLRDVDLPPLEEDDSTPLQREQRRNASLTALVRELQDELARRAPVLAHVEYLKTERWRELREEALERADHACQICKSHDHLQVHHNTYERFGGDEIPSDLLVVCDGCHDIFHTLRRLVGGNFDDYLRSKIEATEA